MFKIKIIIKHFNDNIKNNKKLKTVSLVSSIKCTKTITFIKSSLNTCTYKSLQVNFDCE